MVINTQERNLVDDVYSIMPVVGNRLCAQCRHHFGRLPVPAYHFRSMNTHYSKRTMTTTWYTSNDSSARYSIMTSTTINVTKWIAFSKKQYDLLKVANLSGKPVFLSNWSRSPFKSCYDTFHDSYSNKCCRNLPCVIYFFDIIICLDRYIRRLSFHVQEQSQKEPCRYNNSFIDG